MPEPSTATHRYLKYYALRYSNKANAGRGLLGSRPGGGKGSFWAEILKTRRWSSRGGKAQRAGQQQQQQCKKEE